MSKNCENIFYDLLADSLRRLECAVDDSANDIQQEPFYTNGPDFFKNVDKLHELMEKHDEIIKQRIVEIIQLFEPIRPEIEAFLTFFYTVVTREIEKTGQLVNNDWFFAILFKFLQERHLINVKSETSGPIPHQVVVALLIILKEVYNVYCKSKNKNDN